MNSQCMAQMKPFPRTADMQEKMATFRDAGRYEQDAHIDFEPYEHIYIYQGRQRLLPVSSLVGYPCRGGTRPLGQDRHDGQ